jgi:RNA polymerase sigma-70 factor, ECF subfamily
VDDAEAFTVFYTGAHPTVRAAVRATVGDAPLADDATDEAFVRAAERWEQVRQMANRDGWTYRVAVNWATSWRRKLARRPTRPAEELDRAHRDRYPDLDLAEALTALPLDQRQMLVLRYALGCSVREVADLLGVAEGTVKSRVHRARQRLLAAGWWQDGDDPDRGDVDPFDRAERGRGDQEVLDGRS